ncbi:hypothetical protein [Sinisalibacter lacisalsi]|uniref:Uncharacterized protein n=1 Tax=Sinisalibacter lacisalsi TaxID=1526570 RepID=A0ABQ1QQI8_9RHOB|nr:hypothetical protein [Sinisalibacter lacisalsi]GGD41010.1 hypothetical protein GCM10011358_26070 [Sinisalibacter lacisalsi]
MSPIKNLIRPSVKTALLACVAASALTLVSVDFAVAQGNGQGSGGGSQGSDGGGQGSGGSQAGGGGQGSGGSGEGSGGGQGAGQGGAGSSDDGGGTSPTGGGRPDDKGGKPADSGGGGETDSDRPDWAGTPGGSADRGSPPDAGGGGDLYGDLYVILRDDQGIPILNDDGFVQPVAEDGSLVPLDEEGHVLDETLVQEVEIGRLNISRAPDDVLEGRSEEVVALLNSADAISFDPAGRLVVTVDGQTSTIDSPLENLSIYVALMETGTIEGVNNPVVNSLFLADGVKTVEDLEAAATFLAGATDKTGVFSTDEIAYVNLILGIEPSVVEGTDVQYSGVDFSEFTYDRVATYDGVKTTILVKQDDGSWLEQEIDVYETIFNSVDDDVEDGTIGAFTQAADDSRVVINYIHEYEVPVLPEDL